MKCTVPKGISGSQTDTCNFAPREQDPVSKHWLLRSKRCESQICWLLVFKRYVLVCVKDLCSSSRLPAGCNREGRNRGSLPLCFCRWSYKALVLVCTHPHLEREGEKERVRDRVWSRCQKFHKGKWWDREADTGCIFLRVWAVHPRGVGSLLDSRNENGRQSR